MGPTRTQWGYIDVNLILFVCGLDVELLSRASDIYWHACRTYHVVRRTKPSGREFYSWLSTVFREDFFHLLRRSVV